MTWPTPSPMPPPPPEDASVEAVGEAPALLRAVVLLLIANLSLSLILTVVTVVARHSIVNYQLDHRHITDQAVRESLRHGYVYTIISRVVGNIVVSIVYAFLVRALLRGRRWAYRRVILLSAIGMAALLLLQLTPYPPWMHIEQLVQAAVLGALLYVVTRPQIRAHYASGLPGRDVRRFRSG